MLKYSISPTPNPFAIEMARRGRGHVDIDLRDGGVFQQSPWLAHEIGCKIVGD